MNSGPFEANSGFRFPMPIGVATLRINYSGCRESDDNTIEAVLADVVIEKDMVTAISFDGTAATASSPREDTAITLDRVYRRLEEEEAKRAGALPTPPRLSSP